MLAATRGDVRALLETDFRSGVSSLEVASATGSDATRAKALSDAADYFLRAELQQRLLRHHRGFAAAVCAFLAEREGDDDLARHWASKAVDHYDAALRGVYRRAETAARATGRIPGAKFRRSSTTKPTDAADHGAATASGAPEVSVAVSIGAVALTSFLPVLLPFAPTLARAGQKQLEFRRATKAAQEVPGDQLVQVLNDQAPAVHALASGLGVRTVGRAVGLEIERLRGSHLVVKAALMVGRSASS